MPAAETCGPFLDNSHAILWNGHALRSEPDNEIAETVAATIAESGKRRVQGLVIRADEVAEEVDFAPLKFRGNLHSGNKFDVASRRVPGDLNRRERVVIGDGNRGQICLPSQRDDLLGGELAIARGGVDVEVYPPRARKIPQTAAKTRERGSFRHVRREVRDGRQV